jgi:hypothetical protein
MTRLAVGIALTSALLLLACSESPSDPGELAPLEPIATLYTLSLGEQATLSFRVKGVVVEGVALRVMSERRVAADFPVLDSAALRTGQLLAVGAGQVVVEASRPRSASVSITVDVNVVEPVVVSFPRAGTKVTPEEVLTLRGFALNRAGGVSVNGLPVAIVARDSVSITFRLPAEVFPADGECSGSARLRIALSSGRWNVPADVFRERVGEIGLAVGEFKYLSEAEASCIKLRWTGDSAQYLLAALDVRSINRAKTGAQRPDWRARFQVRHSDLSVSSTSGLAARTPPPPATPINPAARQQRQPAVATLESAGLTAVPLQVGNQFLAPSHRAGPTTAEVVFVPAHVLKVYGDYLVLAQRIGETISASSFAALDSALVFLHGEGTAALAAMFRRPRPVTFSSNGQLVVLLDSLNLGPGTVWLVDPNYNPAASLVLRPIWPTPGPGESPSAIRLRAVAQYLAGAFQWLHWAPTVRATNPLAPTNNAQDGGAALASYELLRRYQGLPLAGQLPFPRFGEARSTAELLGWYENSESLFNWFALQRTAKAKT